MKVKLRIRRFIVIAMLLIMILTGIGGNVIGVKANEIATSTDAVELSMPTDGEKIEEKEEVLPETVEEQEEKLTSESIFNAENFDIKFKLDNVWQAGYNATVTIYNTSDKIIENWCLAFPLNEEISNIWNANINKEHDDYYIIKNAGWNQDIAVGGNISFGITVCEPFTEFPEYYTMIGNELETKTEDYTIDYKITEDWGDGYKAEVTITNNRDTAIEDWRISFDYGDNVITQIWNASILGNVNGRYELSCESYNQNIPSGKSLVFGFMVEPGCSGVLMENIRLSEVETDLSDGMAILFGYMDEGSAELELSTMSSVETPKYEFYMSFDQELYVKIGETEENEFTYSFENDFSKAEIYAIGYDVYGLPAETNHIFVECVDGVYTVILPDTDGDGLEDVYEIYYGSDINVVDTDGDSLNDYYEVYVSATYPSMADSDENGVADGDEDYDKDGLTTLEEVANGTHPIDPDTDYDNLSDGDEINVYGTDPLVADKDEDGLVDGDEIVVGTEPLNPDTDGDEILDGDERFLQTYTYQVENPNCAVREVSITLEGTGNLQSTTYIESVMNKDVLCTGLVGLVGEPFNIETESEFDEATITFKIDETQLGDVGFDDLMFLWYNEDEPAFVELETILDKENMTVSVKTTHFSKYAVVDKQAWQEAWATELNYEADNGIDTYYTVLTIDCSGSMSGNDPIIYNNVGSGYDAQYNSKTCNRISGALEFIDNMGPNDKVAVVLFDSSAFYTLGFTDNKQEIKLALQKIRSNGGTNFNNALKKSMGLFEQDILDSPNIYTRIVFLSDGEDSCSSTLLADANRAGIVIHGIGLGNNYDDGTLKTMSTATGGDYYQADSSVMLLKLYETIYLHDKFDKTDADKDGLYDIFETAGIRLINGEVIYSDPTLKDTDGDELWDGEEVISEVRKADNFFYETVFGQANYYLDIVSYPNLYDSDGDGLNDKEDSACLEEGIYSPFLQKVVVGELSIVSSAYNYAVGHSYLLYQSYIDDRLGLYGLTGGYDITVNNDGNAMYEFVYSSWESITKGEYLTLGNSSATMDSDFEMIETKLLSLDDMDKAGIYYNREIAVDIQAGKEVYDRNYALSMEITNSQLEDIISYHRSRNYYNIATNNCSVVAIKSWNRVSSKEKFDVTISPVVLSCYIMNRRGAFSVNLLDLWGIK